MGLGTQIRLRRLFDHPSGHLFGIAADHFASYGGNIATTGIANLPRALKQLMRSEPDSVTLNYGAAKNFWAPYAGTSALVVETAMFTADDRIRERWTEPEDALRLGADAIAVAIAVRGPEEGKYIRSLADAVHQAEKLEIPVIAHIYPRNYGGDEPVIEFTPDQIAWATRVGIETGADVIKVGYPGDLEAFREIVSGSAVPIVVAGGPQADTLAEALQHISDALAAGAVGAVIGRNIWGDPDPLAAAHAYRSVIHDGLDPASALEQARTSAPQP